MPRRLPLLLIVATLLPLMGAGCATYSDKMSKAHEAAAVGDWEGALTITNGLIGVKDSAALPDSMDKDVPLAVLERGAIKQAVGDYQGSKVDLGTADKSLEFLDISGDAAGEIGKYIYSDSATKFSASATEKLALNTLNMLNYLTLGDPRGARVEARRFTVMRKYLRENFPDDVNGTAGAYLAGFTMEQLGEYGPAMRYYDEVLQNRSLESLRAPVTALSKLTNYRGQAIRPFLAAGKASRSSSGGDLLVVINIGRVPHKVPERMPIGAAVGAYGAFISGNPDVLGYSVFKVVVYPELVDSNSMVREASVVVNGRPAPLELVSNFGLEIRQEYEHIKPRIIGAAISRMIVRAAAAEAARAAGNQDSAGLGWALALATEGLMVAMDKPDTRSWQFLPQTMHVHRQRLPAGKHEVSVQLGPGSQGQFTREVEIPEGGYATVVVTAPR